MTPSYGRCPERRSPQMHKVPSAPRGQSQVELPAPDVSPRMGSAQGWRWGPSLSARAVGLRRSSGTAARPRGSVLTAVGVQQALGPRSSICGLTSGCPAWSQVLDLMIFRDPFQLRMFHGSVIFWAVRWKRDNSWLSAAACPCVVPRAPCNTICTYETLYSCLLPCKNNDWKTLTFQPASAN